MLLFDSPSAVSEKLIGLSNEELVKVARAAAKLTSSGKQLFSKVRQFFEWLRKRGTVETELPKVRVKIEDHPVICLFSSQLSRNRRKSFRGNLHIFLSILIGIEPKQYKNYWTEVRLEKEHAYLNGLMQDKSDVETLTFSKLVLTTTDSNTEVNEPGSGNSTLLERICRIANEELAEIFVQVRIKYPTIYLRIEEVSRLFFKWLRELGWTEAELPEKELPTDKPKRTVKPKPPRKPKKVKLVHPLETLYVIESGLRSKMKRRFSKTFRLFLMTLLNLDETSFETYWTEDRLDAEAKQYQRITEIVSRLEKTTEINDSSVQESDPPHEVAKLQGSPITATEQICEISQERLIFVTGSITLQFPSIAPVLVRELEKFYTWLNFKGWTEANFPTEELTIKVTNAAAEPQGHPLMVGFFASMERKVKKRCRQTVLRSFMANLAGLKTSEFDQYWVGDRLDYERAAMQAIDSESNAVFLTESDQISEGSNINPDEIAEVVPAKATLVELICNISSKDLDCWVNQAIDDAPKFESYIDCTIREFYLWLKAKGWTDSTLSSKKRKNPPSRKEFIHPLIDWYISNLPSGSAVYNRRYLLKVFVMNLLGVDKKGLISFWTPEFVEAEKKSVGILVEISTKSPSSDLIAKVELSAVPCDSKERVFEKICDLTVEQISQITQKCVTQIPSIVKHLPVEIRGFYSFLVAKGLSSVVFPKTARTQTVKLVRQKQARRTKGEHPILKLIVDKVESPRTKSKIAVGLQIFFSELLGIKEKKEYPYFWTANVVAKEIAAFERLVSQAKDEDTPVTQIENSSELANKDERTLVDRICDLNLDEVNKIVEACIEFDPSCSKKLVFAVRELYTHLKNQGISKAEPSKIVSLKASKKRKAPKVKPSGDKILGPAAGTKVKGKKKPTLKPKKVPQPKGEHPLVKLYLESIVSEVIRAKLKPWTRLFIAQILGIKISDYSRYWTTELVAIENEALNIVLEKLAGTSVSLQDVAPDSVSEMLQGSQTKDKTVLEKICMLSDYEISELVLKSFEVDTSDRSSLRRAVSQFYTFLRNRRFTSASFTKILVEQDVTEVKDESVAADQDSGARLEIPLSNPMPSAAEQGSIISVEVPTQSENVTEAESTITAGELTPVESEGSPAASIEETLSIESEADEELRPPSKPRSELEIWIEIVQEQTGPIFVHSTREKNQYDDLCDGSIEVSRDFLIRHLLLAIVPLSFNQISALRLKDISSDLKYLALQNGSSFRIGNKCSIALQAYLESVKQSVLPGSHKNEDDFLFLNRDGGPLFRDTFSVSTLKPHEFYLFRNYLMESMIRDCNLSISQVINFPRLEWLKVIGGVSLDLRAFEKSKGQKRPSHKKAAVKNKIESETMPKDKTEAKAPESQPEGDLSKKAKAEAIAEFHRYPLNLAVKTVASLLIDRMTQDGLQSELLFVADDGGIVI